MGSSQFIHFHHHRSIPKGCIAVTVGQGSEQQRFVIPVIYVNHPLFTQLLKDAEDEYGFDYKGPINIPCHVDYFHHIRGIIRKETTSHHHFFCFKA